MMMLPQTTRGGLAQKGPKNKNSHIVDTESLSQDGEKELGGEGKGERGEKKINYKLDTRCYSTTMSSGYYKTSTQKTNCHQKA